MKSPRLAFIISVSLLYHKTLVPTSVYLTFLERFEKNVIYEVILEKLGV